MDYCCIVWGNINCRLTDSMVKFQKRAARIILDKSIETPSADMFAELNWMAFPDRVKFKKSVLMFKIFNNLTPSYLQDHFTLTSDVHQRPLRSTTENLLYVPKPNIELSRSHCQIMDPNYGMPSQIMSNKAHQLFNSKRNI